MTYATVENGVITKTGRRPNWLIGDTPETSRPLTDAELIQHGRYPVQSPPQYDPATQKLMPIPMAEWQVNEADVGPTYQIVALTPEEIAANQPVPQAPMPTLVASGVFTVTDGWLEGVGAAAGIGMAFAVGTGSYWLLFSDPQPDLAYAAPASSSQGQINVQRYLDYVEITVRDATGALIDPTEFSITITRAL